MAAVLTGTPTAIDWGEVQNPTGQSITIPADATAVYMFWYCFTASAGNGLASATLNSLSPNETFEFPEDTNTNSTGICAWYSPSTGSQTLDIAWDATPAFEPATATVVYVKDGATAWRDADGIATGANAIASVTLTTVAGDLVIKYGVLNDAQVPELTSGWTNGLTATAGSRNTRVSYISAAGVTQECDVQDGVGGTDEDFGSVVAVSIGAAAAGGYKPRRTLLGVG